jgi:hypothetical protein
MQLTLTMDIFASNDETVNLRKTFDIYSKIFEIKFKIENRDFNPIGKSKTDEIFFNLALRSIVKISSKRPLQRWTQEDINKFGIVSFQSSVSYSFIRITYADNLV